MTNLKRSGREDGLIQALAIYLLDAIGISPNFYGISVHDGWPMYHRYFHQYALCNVHHLRELTFIEEELEQCWAGRMKEVLLER